MDLILIDAEFGCEFAVFAESVVPNQPLTRFDYTFRLHLLLDIWLLRSQIRRGDMLERLGSDDVDRISTFIKGVSRSGHSWSNLVSSCRYFGQQLGDR